MRKSGKWALWGAMATLALTSFTQAAEVDQPLNQNQIEENARWGYWGYGYPYYGYYGWYWPTYYSVYSYCALYPGLCYHYLRTSSESFASEITENSDPSVAQSYLAGANEASLFLQNGGEPSASLRQAMNTERDLLLRSGIEDARDLNDQALASLVAARIAKPAANEATPSRR